jgi:diacylglycerol kinase
MHQSKLWETLRSRVRSFQNAGRGVAILFQRETNARIQLTAFVAAVLLGFLSSLSTWEWISIFMVSMIVLMGEALNSALEKACDAITIEPHPSIRAAKDLAAGAVLLASCFALLVGCFIFIPKWFPTIQNIVG